MIRPTATGTDSSDAIDSLISASTTSNPLHDMADALQGRLGLILAALAVGGAAYLIRRSVRARRRAQWGRGVVVSREASRNFGLFQMGRIDPAGDVRALKASWPDASGVVDLPSPFPAPDAAELRTAPWATWIQTER